MGYLEDEEMRRVQNLPKGGVDLKRQKLERGIYVLVQVSRLFLAAVPLDYDNTEPSGNLYGQKVGSHRRNAKALQFLKWPL